MNAIDDATLLRMAEAEILGEAKRAADRHSVAGISGWQPCPKPNKLFLTNTLLQIMTRNRLLSRKKNVKEKEILKHKKGDRKFLQRGTGKQANFVYKKMPIPKKCEEKLNENETCRKIKSKIGTKPNTSKETIKLKNKHVFEKSKLKKT